MGDMIFGIRGLACWCAMRLLLPVLFCMSSNAEEIPKINFDIVNVYPHDTKASTEGLFYRDGYLYESTGGYGTSSIRKVRTKTGAVLQLSSLPASYFGEGIADWKDKIVALTYTSGVGIVYDLRTFKTLSSFNYSWEGWGITHDAHSLIMSDGTAALHFIDPASFRQTGEIHVTYDGVPLRNLNELEWVDGRIFANVWLANWVAIIDPISGHVVGVLDLQGLVHKLPAGSSREPNGIAYDKADNYLFVTGKLWPEMFELRLRAVHKSGSQLLGG